MKHYVTDTHPLIWALSSDSRLSPTARAVFEAADAGQVTIIIPSIVVVEMIYLSEKGRIPAHLVDDLLTDVSQPGLSYRLGELDASVITALREIPRHLIPDMPDRIIAATAKAAGVIIASSSDILSKMPKSYIEGVFDNINRKIGAGTVFGGVYEIEDATSVHLFTMYAGMDLPKERIARLVDEIKNAHKIEVHKEEKKENVSDMLSDMGIEDLDNL